MAKAASKTRRAAPRSKPLAVCATRVSPLDGVIRQGRYGADHEGGPGVTLSHRHPLSIATVIARKGKARALGEVMKKDFGLDLPEPGISASARQMTIHWCGPEQWYVVSPKHDEGELFNELKISLDAKASVSEQSHGRVVIVVEGPRVRDVLAKGTPVDLHPSVFAPGQCAVTQMAHVGVHIAQTGPDQFELSLFRGFAESFWEWLCEMSAEFGYEVV